MGWLRPRAPSKQLLSILPTRPVRSSASRRHLTADDTINGILTLGPTGAAPALAALDRVWPARHNGAGDLRPFA